MHLYHKSSLYRNSSASRGMLHCNMSAHCVPLSTFLVVMTSHSSTLIYALASPTQIRMLIMHETNTGTCIDHDAALQWPACRQPGLHSPQALQVWKEVPASRRGSVSASSSHVRRSAQKMWRSGGKSSGSSRLNRDR